MSTKLPRTHPLSSPFHEPVRLALMTELCGAAEGLSFTELREKLDLSDGNLSRHLQYLQEHGAVRIRKEFVDAKPRTTIHLLAQGREEFLRYLDTLESVIKRAGDFARSEDLKSSRAARLVNTRIKART